MHSTALQKVKQRYNTTYVVCVCF